jgi:uncharacterized OB-fold protein
VSALAELVVAGSPPRLRCSRCGACGLVAFPAERYGCERCGTEPDRHEPLELDAVGTARVAAEVHRHHQPQPPTPFVVVQVDVDGGPSLKGVLAGTGIAAGRRVTGDLTPDGVFRWLAAG